MPVPVLAAGGDKAGPESDFFQFPQQSAVSFLLDQGVQDPVVDGEGRDDTIPVRADFDGPVVMVAVSACIAAEFLVRAPVMDFVATHQAVLFFPWGDLVSHGCLFGFSSKMEEGSDFSKHC